MHFEEEAVTSPEASGADIETSEDDPNMETDAVDDNETLKWLGCSTQRPTLMI